MEPPEGVKNLIDTFFTTLGRRELAQCQSILAELDLICPENSDCRPWFDYLSGVLAFELHKDLAAAKRAFSQLLASTEPNLVLQGRLLIALGRIHRYEGNLGAAIASYEQSLSIFDRLHLPIEQAKVWKNIAFCYQIGFTQGDFGPAVLEKAVRCCYSALDILKTQEITPQNQAIESTVWNALGLVYRDLGDWDQAIVCHERDLALCSALDDRFGMGLAYGNLGEMYYLRGPDDWQVALPHYQKALDIIREFHDQYAEVEVLANLAFLYQKWHAPETALNYYSQALSLIEILRAEGTSEQARAGYFATVADTYANAVLLCLDTGDLVQAFDIVERARARAFLDMLDARSPDLVRQMEAATVTLAEVQASLPDDALLLEYFTTGLIEAYHDRTASVQTPQRHRFPSAMTLIFAVTRHAVQVYNAELSPNDLRPRHLDSIVQRHFLQPAIRRTLYKRLIAPVEGLLNGRRRVYLVPHGPLHYIPFQALVALDGSTLLREGGPQLIYSPSASILFRPGRAASDQAPAPGLALGYNGAGSSRLRFAEEEARSVAHLIGGQTLLGRRSKKAALYKRAARYRLLHLSCHGTFDPEAPLASALHLSPGEALTALDILDHLHLRCDLVTLSACESGLSRVRRGDELVGLVRAFMYAGTPALVCTLWRVDERSTRILMEKFYQEVQSGVDFAEALKRAQLYLKNLSRKEALDILTHSHTNETRTPGNVASKGTSGAIRRSASVVARARSYLKGLTSKSRSKQDAILLHGADEDQVFTDPYYWAPFILIGEHRLR